jgi:SAM-dependent methyltransferase
MDSYTKTLTVSGFAAASLRMYDRLAKRIVPGHRHTQIVYHEWLLSVLSTECDWLDLGCGHQILPPWVNADEAGIIARCRTAVGIDLDLPSLRQNASLRDRVMGTLERLPFSGGSLDLVTANMVVEHLAAPEAVLAEVTRVLRPGGRFLFHTPNRNAPSLRIAAHTPQRLKTQLVWILEQRRGEDVFPTHYRMNTLEDVYRIAAHSGLKVERFEQVSSAAVTAMLGPLAIPELFFLRLLNSERLSGLRSNILAILRK